MEYKVLIGFQHITGYKNPGELAELDAEEAERRLAAGEIEKPEQVTSKRKSKQAEGEAGAE